MDFKPSFSVGEVVSHSQISDEFKCGNMGGMRRSHTTNTLVIISDHTKAIYDDKWYGDELHYTGMGKIGDQTLTSSNRTLAESNTNGVSVHLFEVLQAKQYIYHGVVKLSGAPYQEMQNDDAGNPRKVWMFPLAPVEKAVAIDQQAYAGYVSGREKKARSLSDTALKDAAKARSKKTVANRSVTSSVYVRDPFVAEYAKRRAKGICQLCNMKAPFLDKNGNPYLESHHIEWLASGGQDSVENTVALCPNCHRKMHIVNDPKDVERLKKANKQPVE